MEIYLFKNAESSNFKRLLEEAVGVVRHGSIEWHSSPNQENRANFEYVGWFCSNNDVTSLLIDTNCYDVIFSVAKALSSPVVDIRFQEKTFWEASLYVGKEVKMDFSTSPNHWGKVEAKSFFCELSVLSEIWGVPVDQFDRYLVDWGLSEVWIEDLKMMSPTFVKRGEKAYPSDTHKYGDLYQGLDFLRALGASLPSDGEQFKVYLPPIQR